MSRWKSAARRVVNGTPHKALIGAWTNEAHRRCRRSLVTCTRIAISATRECGPHVIATQRTGQSEWLSAVRCPTSLMLVLRFYRAHARAEVVCLPVQDRGRFIESEEVEPT
jgi:hypothetical protein